MKLRGFPPNDVPALSYVGSPGGVLISVDITGGLGASWDTISGKPAVVAAGATQAAARSAIGAVAQTDIDTAVTNLKGTAGAALDTLGELSDALGDDANYAATVTTALAGKVPTTRQVNGHALTADVTVTKSDVGLGNVDNTADTAKPVSTAQQTALDGKERKRVVNVKDYGAVGDGTTNDTTAIQTAWTAVGQNGTLFFPAGHYKVAAKIADLNYPGQSLEGDGMGSTFIEPTSAVTGDVIRWQMNPWNVASAGRIRNLTLDGTNAGAGACGIHLGDLMSHRMENVEVRAFDKTGSIGIHVDNNTHWTEEGVWTNVYANLNKVGIQFNTTGGTNSWGYNRLDIRVNAWGGQTGIVFKGGGSLYNTHLSVTGNLADAGCIGIDLQDTVNLHGTFHIAMEGNGGGGATGMKLASGAYLKGSGYIDLKQGDFVLANVNAGTFNLGFSGWFNAATIGGGEGFQSSGTAPVFAGGVNIGYTSALISSGNGVPNWVSTTGNFFLRGDSDANGPHIYKCVNGAAGTWVAVDITPAQLAAKAPLDATVNAQTGTTYTFVAGDDGKVVTASNASAQTYTVPQNSAAAIPIGAYIEIIQLGAGQVTFAAGTGATLNSRGGALKINGQYGVAALRKVSTNGFILTGDLTT